VNATKVRPETAPVDVRLDAFSRPDGPEVFSAITHVNQVWLPDPFDVESIHSGAREIFARLIQRATTSPPPASGKSLLLLGEAGSGKTHLMRAFRNRVHADGNGYFVYMQMTTRQESYPRYVLSNVIDALEHPYCQPHPATGLDRLASGLLDAIVNVSPDQRAQLQNGEFGPEELARQVHNLADSAIQQPQFRTMDIDLLRAVLYLLSPDNRIRSRVVKWLRCENLSRFDREMVGDLVPRPNDHMPMKTIVELGLLMSMVHDAALVICADQIEEMIDAAAESTAAGDVFRRMVDTLIEVNTSVPTSIVVVACLEDYYVRGRELLQQPKLDRLEHDPGPVRLSAHRTVDEIEAIVERRLEFLYEYFDLTIDPECVTLPFTERFLTALSGMSSRQVLNHCRQEQERAFRGEDKIGDGPANQEGPPETPPPENPLQLLWNDFHLSSASPVLDNDSDLATLLASAIDSGSAEMGKDVHFAADHNGRMIQVEIHRAGNAIDKLLVAICDRPAQGNGLKKQIEEVAKLADELPAVFVRSSPYPKSPTAVVMKRLAELIAPKGKGRRVEVQNSDWRIMAAFRDFKEKHGGDPTFADWQQSQRPLMSLASLRDILAVERLAASSARTPSSTQKTPSSTQKPTSPKGAASDPGMAPSLRVPLTPKGAIRIGLTRGIVPSPVHVYPMELTQHAAFLGGSGSGKTTAALVIIEQLLMCGIPAVLIDRKGDLARYADPDAWKSVNGDSELAIRLRRLHDALEVALFTPGSDSGRPLTLPIVPVDFAQLPSAERQQVAGFAASALGGMMGYRPNSTDPRPAILGKAIEVIAAQQGQTVTVRALQQMIEEQDESLILAVGGFEAKHYKKLSENLLTLILQRQSLLEGHGESLDFDALLGGGAHARTEKTRLTIINTQYLGGSGAVDFWLAQFLLAAGRWAARNPSPDRLQAVFLFDEADQYLPATRQPATKGPMENLLKRARSAGIGLFLATQSPGDFDYKCRDQIRLWFIGRVKESTAIAKLKPMLEAAKIDAASKLPSQGTGQFFMVREREVLPIQTDRSLISTQQLPVDRILDIAACPV
jgi:energy-coupling factor transporter ATP-binding protein EcfA2